MMHCLEIERISNARLQESTKSHFPRAFLSPCLNLHYLCFAGKFATELHKPHQKKFFGPYKNYLSEWYSYGVSWQYL